MLFLKQYNLATSAPRIYATPFFYSCFEFCQVTKRLALGGDKEAAEMAKRTEEMLKALYAGSPNVKQLEGLLATMSVK